MRKLNPSIYEINTRLFLREKNLKWILDIPHTFWEDLKGKGFDYVWMMGVWDTCGSIIEKCCFSEGLTYAYNRALKDWQKEDVIGSPYAVNKYIPHKDIGTMQDLRALRDLLHTFDMGLILDFVPNHFSADSELIKEHPEYFVRVKKEEYESDPHTFFESSVMPGNYFAHGRDPFFPAWTDTVQVNFRSTGLRTFYLETLSGLSEVCDGVRCDMAMLALNNVFRNTWGMLLPEEEEPEEEFWRGLITGVRRNTPNFLFIAEAYWDLEWELQQLGFSFTYDKRLLDRLRDAGAEKVRDHLKAEESYQIRSLRFLENHDEDRAMAALGKEKSSAAAVIISTVQGMRFYHDGQFQGKRIRVPVQLGREPKEQVVESVEAFYNKLLAITSDKLFKDGRWKMRECSPVSPHDDSCTNLMAWTWTLENKHALVVVNYSDRVSVCRIRLPLDDSTAELFDLTDVLNNTTYKRVKDEVINTGLFIELRPYQSHIFRY